MRLIPLHYSFVVSRQFTIAVADGISVFIDATFLLFNYDESLTPVWCMVGISLWPEGFMAWAKTVRLTCMA
jgi:hypothetical protein